MKRPNMKPLEIDGSKIKNISDFGNILVSIIDSGAKGRGWIEDNLDAINDDLWQIEQLGYDKVVINNSERMKENLGVEATINHKQNLLRGTSFEENKKKMKKDIKQLKLEEGETLFDTIVSMFSSKKIKLELR